MANRNQAISKVFMSEGAQSVDLTRTITDAVHKALENHTDLSQGANQIRVVSPTAGAPSTSRRFIQKNRNLTAGAEDMLAMAGVTYEKASKEQQVEMRKSCARHCTSQGRTVCKYCKGAGFAAMNEPSRNTKQVNKAVDVVAKFNSSELHRV